VFELIAALLPRLWRASTLAIATPQSAEHRRLARSISRDSPAIIEAAQNKKAPIALVLPDFACVGGPNSFGQRKALLLADGRIARRIGRSCREESGMERYEKNSGTL
jgi:hypothetical protein